MLDGLRRRLRDARSQLANVAWAKQWEAARAIATPWMKQELEAGRTKLREARKVDAVIARDVLEQAVRDAAPPGVPLELAVLPGSALRERFPDGPMERRTLHLVGKMRMTHRAIPSEAVLVVALFSDVAADYFVESMGADIANTLRDHYGDGIAISDAQDSVPVVLKELAVAAGLGTIGKNALFFSNRFGFNCKLTAIFLNAPVDRYDATPTTTAWKLPDCSTCNLCVEACPVSAFDNYEITKVASCDRLISADSKAPRSARSGTTKPSSRSSRTCSPTAPRSSSG